METRHDQIFNKCSEKYVAFTLKVHNLWILESSEKSPTQTFFMSVFFSQTFIDHRTTGEGGEHFFNSSLSLPPGLQTLSH